MHRFYLPPEHCRGATIELAEAEAHHALRVLRITIGERVTVLDGAGAEFKCDVRATTKRGVTLAVLEKNTAAALPCQITLIQAVPKAKAMDYIVQKATELGAVRVVPILTERTVVQLAAADAADKAEKWQQIAIESIKQCGSQWLTKIEPPLPLKACLARNDSYELTLIASLRSDRRHPRESIRDFQASHQRLPTSACIWIGPEGDFTPEEMLAIQNHGAKPISLGRLVLRSDTAAIAALAVLNHELQS